MTAPSRLCYTSQMSGQTGRLTVADRLAARVLAPVGQADRQAAALRVVDWLGCAIAGAVSPIGVALRGLPAGDGRASVILGADTSPAAAAYRNGAFGNVLEMDDVDKRAILHPGPSVIPAALAAAQALDRAGAAFLDAVVAGYEATIRVGRAVGPGHYAFWHNTGTCGPFGAAAATGRLMGLDADRLAHAFGLAGTTAGGLWQTRHEAGNDAKQIHTARAAEGGYQSATLAGAGVRGPLQIFEGPQGFFAAMCPGADPQAIIPPQGAPWAVHETSFKPWPACRHAHAAIDAALRLKGRVDPAAIRAIHVETYPDAITFCDRPDPQTVLQAKFSLQHAMAVVFLRGTPSLADFEPAAFGADDLRALSGKVSVTAGEPFISAYPARYGASVAVTLASGETLTAEARDAWGDPENPMSEADIVAKAVTLGVEGAGRARAAVEALIEAALGLSRAPDLTGLKAALARLG